MSPFGSIAAGTLISRSQALLQLSEREVDVRLGRRWQVVLPGVYSTSLAPLTDHDLGVAALLHAGSEAVLTDVAALRLYRVPFLPDDPTIHVLVPNRVQRASRQFVTIVRTTRQPPVVMLDGLPVAPLARALCDFARRQPDERASIAVVAAAVQLDKVLVARLFEEARMGSARGRPRLLRVLAPIAAGIRSAPEHDFRELVRSSHVLPEPLWNPTLLLPDGSQLSPDALFEDAALIHEVNGRRYHAPDEAGEDRFEHMQLRHDLLATSGFTVLHNWPKRLRTEARTVMAQVEECYLRLRGCGLPAGVVMLRRGPTSS
jgi:hypothetical protein